MSIIHLFSFVDEMLVNSSSQILLLILDLIYLLFSILTNCLYPQIRCEWGVQRLVGDQPISPGLPLYGQITFICRRLIVLSPGQYGQAKS